MFYPSRHLPCPQHFLLTAAALPLNAGKVMRMSDRGAENVFLRLRWPQTDGKPVCPNCDRHPKVAVIIPPRATAVPSETTATQRDQHIAEIEKHGRIGWQRRPGYSRGSLVETGMYRARDTPRFL